MSFYDEAVATGDFQWLDDLIKGKAHVKAHFRKDPTTGKLVYIQEHERELHPTHVVFAKGDKVKFTEGPHAGKEFEVKGYSEDKNVLRISHPDHYNIAVAPHKVEHVEKTHENTPGEVEKPEPEQESPIEPTSERVKLVAGHKFVWDEDHGGYLWANDHGVSKKMSSTVAPALLSALNGDGFEGEIVGDGIAKKIKITKFPDEQEPTSERKPEQVKEVAGHAFSWSDKHAGYLLMNKENGFTKTFSNDKQAEDALWKLHEEGFGGFIIGYGKPVKVIKITKFPEEQEPTFDDDDPDEDVYISNAITIDQHASFMKKLYQGEVSIGELKDAFQHFVASKDAIQKELESKTVKELSEYGFTHAKKKSEIVKQILHSMMDKYAPGGGVLWQPFSEKYEEAVQKHINRLTDDDIQNVAGKVKSKKEFHAKATTNPETIEEYKHFIRHVGEDFIDPWMEEHYQSLKKQKADQEATEQAKIPPKIETKEVGFHGHFLADKKGVKVFANHEEAKAEADKLQGHGFNAHPIGGIVKISNKGEGPPKLSDASVKKVKVGKDTWYANDNGIAQGFDSDDEALVVAHKLQSLGHNAVPSGAGIIFKDSSEAPKIDFTYHETTHTKHGHPLFVAKLTEKVDKPTYSNLLSQAKKLGGYYSSYSQGGAVPGFTFKDKAKAQQFMAEAKGEEIDVDAKSGPTAGELQNLQFKAVKGYLKLQDKASYHEDIQHEYHRIDTMPDNALQARIGKIKSNQKLYDFYIALVYKGKYQLATLAFEELKKRVGQHLKGE